jgi:hypothetical protein
MGPFGRMPRVRRALAIGCVATIAVADYVILRRRPRWIIIGLFDEPAHLATAVLILLNLREPPRGTDAAAFLVASVAIDVDHLPQALRPLHPQAGDPRPPTHNLLVPAALALAGQRWAALGVLAHFTRDVSNASGIPILKRERRLPYAIYAASIAALGLRAARQRATLTAGL